jgi:hypothetical protein
VAFTHAHFGVALFLARRAPTAGPCAVASDKPRFIRVKKVLRSALFVFHPAKAGKPFGFL